MIEEGMSEVEHGDVVAPGEDEEAESATKSTKNQRAEELEVFWAYIRNMLTNFESLALDRIYQVGFSTRNGLKYGMKLLIITVYLLTSTAFKSSFYILDAENVCNAAWS